MIRIVVADDDGIVRDGVAALLEGLEDMEIEVVGRAEDGMQAVSEIEKRKPDVALLDVRMPEASGIDALRTLRARGNATPVIFLTTFDDNATYAEALAAGMHGWLLKGEDAEDLAGALAAVASGGTRLVPHYDDDVGASLPPLPVPLTQRETQVLRLAARGMSNKSIGDALGTTEGTVRNQMSSIMQKLNAKSRWDAVRIAARRGIL